MIMVGIYLIENKINNKVYVGQSWDIKERWHRHKQNSNRAKHQKEHLYLSMNKYGLSNFEFSVIKEMYENVSQSDLDFQEQFFIHFFHSDNKEFGYNKREAGSHGRHAKESNEKNRLSHLGKSVNKGIPKTEEAKRNMSLNAPDRLGAKNNMYGKKHSVETKLKISEKAKKRVGPKNPFYGKKHSLEMKLKMSERGKKLVGDKNPMYGKKLSVEIRLKISEAAKKRVGDKNPMYGKKHSVETRLKISKSNSGRKHSIETRLKISKSRSGKNV